jgi:bifunctional UDP-N-acetylglucosamine pyrophosphorylase/glucosamine-1-phosphate N-acetyltransferase
LPVDFQGAVVVTSGDVPLLDPEQTIEALIDTHLRENLSATILTTLQPTPPDTAAFCAATDW